jgi:hypothetical protein
MGCFANLLIGATPPYLPPVDDVFALSTTRGGGTRLSFGAIVTHTKEWVYLSDGKTVPVTGLLPGKGPPRHEIRNYHSEKHRCTQWGKMVGMCMLPVDSVEFELERKVMPCRGPEGPRIPLFVPLF